MKKYLVLSTGAALLLTVVTACGHAAEQKDGAAAEAAAAAPSETSAKTSEAVSVTNENGSVSKTFTECNVTTNGNMVTERRRETRTVTDTAGNVLETSTSEYAQSYPVGDVGMVSLASSVASQTGTEPTEVKNDSFLSLAFGSVLEGTNFVQDVEDPTLLRTTFTPEKPLAGFDDYYACVTPKTHKVVKVYACAKEAVEPGARWRRHYLIEALEKRYNTWARLCSYSRPRYAFDLGSGRWAVACLANASRDYETVVCAWDEAMLATAAEELEELRAEARKNAAEKRSRRVSEAQSAF